MRVIGAGFGRTGTHSLKLALETLGFGPCHHMVEMIGSVQQNGWFGGAARGEPQDWDLVYGGYGSAVDWPTAYFWRELADYFSNAKIILTVRDSGDWFESMSRTIFRTWGAQFDPAHFGNAVIKRDVFGGKLDRDHAIEVFEAHNALVTATMPPARLLVYQTTEGWTPLCEFLEVPVPGESFPHSNATSEFAARFR